MRTPTEVDLTAEDLDATADGDRFPRLTDTRQTILAAAKELVARKGAGRTTVRDITAASGANSGAVNYHFQSKDALVRRAVLEITGDVNRARLTRLDQYEREAKGRPLSARQILTALIEPIVDVSRASDGGSLYVRCMFQMRIDSRAALESFDLNANVASRFLDAIGRTFPELSEDDAIWHYEAARGASIHLLANLDPVSRRFELLALRNGGQLPPSPAYGLDHAQVARVIDLILAGFARAGG